MNYWIFIAFENRAPPLKEFTPPMPIPKRASLITAPSRLLDLFLDDGLSYIPQNLEYSHSDELDANKADLRPKGCEKKSNVGRPKKVINASDVVKLHLEGLSKKEIASSLSVSVRTLERFIKKLRLQKQNYRADMLTL